MFGFSPYMLIHLTGGPYLALVALLPVFVLLVLRRVQGSIGARAFVIAMALALIGQYLISSEVLATATLFGAVALVLAYVLLPERRRALLDTVRLLIVAYVVIAVLISPFLYFFFFGHQYPPGAIDFPADLSAYVLPSPLMAITRRVPAFVGSNTESYLGLPLVVLIVAFAWRERRNRTAWLAVAVAGGRRALRAGRPPGGARAQDVDPGCRGWCWRSCRSCATRSRCAWPCSWSCRRR